MGIIEMLILFVILGGGIGALALIALAVSKGRPGLAALVGGLALLVVVGIIAIVGAIIYLRMGRPVAISTPMWQSGPVTDITQMTVGAGQELVTYPQSESHPTWSFAIAPVGVLMVCGIVALIVIAAWRGLAHSTSGLGKMWPALLVLPLLAWFFIGSIGYRSSTHVASENAAQIGELMQQQQAALVSQQEAMAKRVVSMSNDVQNRIDNMDIHELMDKFEAPRIALQAASSPTAAPAALAISAAASAQAAPTAQRAAEPTSATKANTSKADSPTANPKDRASSKRKRTAKPPSDSTGVAMVKEATAIAIAATPPDVTARPENPAGLPPAWIDAPPKRTGDIRREVIATEEYESVDECYLAADIYLMLKAYEHLQQLVDRPYADGVLPSITFPKGMILADNNIIATGHTHPYWNDYRIRQLLDLGIGIDYLRREIVAKDPKNNESREYLASVDRSVGPMKKLYMQIEFSPAVDRQFRLHWDAYYRQERFAMVGVGAASVLGLLSMVWGLLKVDTATKGYYTKRLFLGVPAAIIGGSLLLLFWDIVT